MTGRPLPHCLFLGRPGTGKTQLAKALAEEVGGPFVYINSATVRDPDAIAQAALKAVGGILLLDEVHALDRKVSESTFTLLDEGTVMVQRPIIGAGWEYRWIETADEWPVDTPGYWNGARLYEVRVPVETKRTEAVPTIVGAITVIGATTDEALLPPALLSRLSRLTVRLRPYTPEELGRISIKHATDLGLHITANAERLISLRSRRTPRRVKQLTERAGDRTWADHRNIITEDDALDALAAMGVDAEGLEEPHREMLRILVDSGGGLSRTSLANHMGLPPKGADLYFGELMAKGLVMIGRRHDVTDAGRAALA